MSPPAKIVRLLDGNVLIALADESHVHHAAAKAWFVATQPWFATCPITQGTLVRILLRLHTQAHVSVVVATLRQLTGHPHHRFWPDALDYLRVNWKGVLGHRQVTDAYLVALARANGGKLATFDRGLAALHADIAELIESK